MGGAFRLLRIQITRSFLFFPSFLLKNARTEESSGGRQVDDASLFNTSLAETAFAFSPGKASKTRCSISKGSNNAQLLTDADTESLVFPYLSELLPNLFIPVREKRAAIATAGAKLVRSFFDWPCLCWLFRFQFISFSISGAAAERSRIQFQFTSSKSAALSSSSSRERRKVFDIISTVSPEEYDTRSRYIYGGRCQYHWQQI